MSDPDAAGADRENSRGTLAFEDLEPGTVFELGAWEMSAADIIEFATEFDSQPMHLDRQAAEASLLGGLSASGWHTSAIFMRLFCDGLLLHSTVQTLLGFEIIRWRLPVMADDTIRGRTEILDRYPASDQPGSGEVIMGHTLLNQRGETVCQLRGTVLFAMRGNGR